MISHKPRKEPEFTRRVRAGLFSHFAFSRLVFQDNKFLLDFDSFTLLEQISLRLLTLHRKNRKKQSTQANAVYYGS